MIEDVAGRRFDYVVSQRRAAVGVAIGAYGWLGGFAVLALHVPIVQTLMISTFGFLWLFGVPYLLTPWWFEGVFRSVRQRDIPGDRAV